MKVLVIIMMIVLSMIIGIYAASLAIRLVLSMIFHEVKVAGNNIITLGRKNKI